MASIDDINFGDLGGAVSDLFGGIGDLTESQGYATAAKIAQSNEQLEQASTAIQETQANRQIYQAQGATQAAYGNAGLAMSGSAQDVLRMGAQQGALKKQILGVQGQINEQNYAEQAQSFSQMASTATTAAAGSFGSGLLSAVGGLFSFL
jgi:hypothetical protein